MEFLYDEISCLGGVGGYVVVDVFVEFVVGVYMVDWIGGIV